MATIAVTADHLKLLKQMRFDWDGGCEWGAVSSDCKRPFGNSDVPRDVSELLGREVEHDEALRLTIELAAIVDFAVQAAHTIIITGTSLPLPYRAERELR